MKKNDRRGLEIFIRPDTWMGMGVLSFAVFLFLFISASGAYAYVCTDCHGTTGPHQAACSTSDCMSCHGDKTISHPSGAGTPSVCTACHTTTPHPIVGAGTSLAATCVTSACHGQGGIAHLFTADQLLPYKSIHTGLSAPSTSCSACHGPGGSYPSEHYTPTATCSNCHTTRPGVASTMVLAHPDAVGGPSTACETCHTVGNKPNEMTACANSSCHGPGGTAHLRNDFNTLRTLAAEMHVPADIPRALECKGCHDGVYQKPFAHPAGGAECSTCHPRAGVSPTNVETCKSCHDNGSAHKFSEATLVTRAHDMHQFGAVTPSVDCTSCHSGIIISSMNHPVTPETPDTCADCHTRGGVAPEVQAACGGCHDGSPGPAFSTSSLQTYAADMHNTKPHANFNTNVNYSASYTLDFNAAASTCPAGYTCTFSWDFDNNGTTDATGMTATKTFAGVGPYPVTLTVRTDSNAADSITKNVAPVVINAAPVVCSTDWTFSNRTVTFDDCSTDDGTAAVYVNWGDGQSARSYTLGQQDITYTYAVNSTYHVTHWVQDAGSYRTSESLTLTIPLKLKVSVSALGDGTGEALNAPLGSALVKIYKAGVLKAQGYTSATTGTFTSQQVIEPGNVRMTITKSGKTFNCDSTGSGTNVPVNFATPPVDVTVSCTY